MLKLECANIKPSPANAEIKKFIDLYRREGRTQIDYVYEVICDTTFQSIDSVEVYHKVVAWLFIGDELKNPINQLTASVVFFALCNNCQKDRNVVITNITQAYTMYLETENDYTQLKKIASAKEHPRFEDFVTTFKMIHEGFDVKFKIPVRFIGGKSGTWRMLDFKTLPEFVWNDGTTSQITWKDFRQFFTGNQFPPGKLGVKNGEKIGDKFNHDMRTFVGVLNYIGFHLDREIEIHDIMENYFYSVHDNKLNIGTFRNGRNYQLNDIQQDCFHNNTLLPTKDYFIVASGGKWTLYRV